MSDPVEEWASCAECGGDREVADLDESGRCEVCTMHESKRPSPAKPESKRKSARALQAAAARFIEARYIAAGLRIPVEAIKLNEANPGVTVRTKSVLPLWYYDQKITLPAGTELQIDGWHMPTDDEYFGYEALEYPAGPEAAPIQNLRIRTKDSRGHEILVAPQELQALDVVPQVEEDLRQPGMPGESVFDLPARQLGPESPSQIPGANPAPGQTPSPESTAVDRPRRPAPRPAPVGDQSLSTQDLVAPTRVTQPPQSAA